MTAMRSVASILLVIALLPSGCDEAPSNDDGIMVAPHSLTCDDVVRDIRDACDPPRLVGRDAYLSCRSDAEPSPDYCAWDMECSAEYDEQQDAWRAATDPSCVDDSSCPPCPD